MKPTPPRPGPPRRPQRRSRVGAVSALLAALMWMPAGQITSAAAPQAPTSAADTGTAAAASRTGQTALEPAALAARIDALIDARAGGPDAGPADDATFLRRAWLDLAGVIPPASEVKAFLADRSADKRTRLIDRLLASEDFGRRMADALSVAWLERRPGTVVAEDAWTRWLGDAFRTGRPFDAVVAEMIRADADRPEDRPAARLLADAAKGDPVTIALDVGRLFLGMNLACARCHDHPTVNEWKQGDYYGLLAFVSTDKLVNDPGAKRMRLVEGLPAGRLDFESVLTGKKGVTGPRVPGASEVAIPPVEKGKEYVVPPVRGGSPGVPSFRARVRLAEELTRNAPPRFARAAANRFWLLMMGRGLVHPPDQDHAGNPPSHPELLDLLAGEFRASGWDVRRLLRGIAMSKAYQRAGAFADGRKTTDVRPESYRLAIPKGQSAEQLAASVMRALEWADPADGATTETTGSVPPPAPATGTAVTKVTGKSAIAPPTGRPADKRPFVLKDYLNAKPGARPPATRAEVTALFRSVFALPPGEPDIEFLPSAGQALFLRHERLLLARLAPGAGGLVDRLSALRPAAAVEELYLTVLSRPPADDERREAVAHLAGKSDGTVSAARLSELAWALLASAEFRLVH